MGVGIDGEHRPHLPGGLRVSPVQVEARWEGVDLQGRMRLHGGLHDSLHVQLNGLSLLDQATGGMRQHVDVLVLHGGDYPLGHLLLRHFEP